MATIITYNGTQIASTDETAPVAVTYGGSTIASIAEGVTKTLNCSGKYMNTNVVVGSKTLNCANKIMSGNVTVEVEQMGDTDLVDFLEAKYTYYENDLVETISSYAFAGNETITTLKFPNLTTIESYAFYGMTNLQTVYVGTNTSVVCVRNDNTFGDCNSLQHIYVPNGLVTAYQSSEDWSDLSSIISGV